MTEQERNDAIRKLGDLKDQGLLTNDEYIEKVAMLADKKPRQQPHQPERKGNDGKAVLIFIACLVLAAIGYFVSQQMQEDKARTVSATKSPSGISYTGYNKGLTQDEKGSALVFAKRLVKQQLPAPSTASFPWSFDEYEFVMNSGICTVKGHLDAQNANGAKIRWKFESCFDMWKDGDDYKATERYTNVYPAK